MRVCVRMCAHAGLRASAHIGVRACVCVCMPVRHKMNQIHVNARLNVESNRKTMNHFPTQCFGKCSMGMNAKISQKIFRQTNKMKKKGIRRNKK